MSIRYQCEQCGTVLKIKDSLAGTRGRCPDCRFKFTVPLQSNVSESTVLRNGNDIQEMAMEAPSSKSLDPGGSGTALPATDAGSAIESQSEADSSSSSSSSRESRAVPPASKSGVLPGTRSEPTGDQKPAGKPARPVAASQPAESGQSEKTGQAAKSNQSEKPGQAAKPKPARPAEPPAPAVTAPSATTKADAGEDALSEMPDAEQESAASPVEDATAGESTVRETATGESAVEEAAVEAGAVGEPDAAEPDPDEFDAAAFLMDDAPPGTKLTAGLSTAPAESETKPATDSLGRRYLGGGPAKAAVPEAAGASVTTQAVLPQEEPRRPRLRVTATRRQWMLSAPLLLLYVVLAGGTYWLASRYWTPGLPLPDLSQAAGVVTLDGKPLPDVVVHLTPVNATQGTSSGGTPLRISDALGFSGPDGTFRFTYLGHTGAPLGKARIWIEPTTLAAFKSIPAQFQRAGSDLRDVREAGNDGKFDLTLKSQP